MDDPSPGHIALNQEEPLVEQEIALPEGTARLHLRVNVPEKVSLSVEIEAYTPDGRLIGLHDVTFGGAARQPWRVFARLAARASAYLRVVQLASAATLARWLMWSALVVYSLTRLVALPAFPIYFFTDEAVQTVLAADLLRDGLKNYSGEFLPAFFPNGAQYNLGTSVYLQALPYFFFGKSIWVTRGTAALMTLLAAVCVGLMMKKFFKKDDAWLAVMFLSVTPAWFLHSRTAFETSLATTFYAVFLYFYLLYRAGNSRAFYGVVISGALTFYSYSPARIVMLVICGLLFFADLRYHWSQRAVVARGLGLGLLLALPFVRFLINHPEASIQQMRMLGSVWMADVPVMEKLDVTVGEYLHGLDPLYWYLPQNFDLSRHILLGYGNLLRPTLPLGLLGLGIALKNIRKPAYRTMLIAVLAAPSGAALVRLGITRVLFMVIPMAILTALAASDILERVRLKLKFSWKTLATGAFVVLAGVNGYMLYDALANGALWFRGYSLAGMQYGSQQVFGEIRQYLEEHPDTHIILSPSWANGTDVIARFFFDDPLPFDLGSAVGYYSIARPIGKTDLFIMIPEEYQDLPQDRFSEIKVEKTLPYPDGRPGFYFVRLKYKDNIQEIIAKELEERRKLVFETLQVGAQEIQIGYSKLDMGQVEFLFDGNPMTLIRTWSLNPMQINLEFATPIVKKKIGFRVGGTPTTITLKVWLEGEREPIRLQSKLEEVGTPRDAFIDLPEGKITRIDIEIFNNNDLADGHVHLWDILFQ